MAYLLYKWLYNPENVFSFMRLVSYISFRSIFAFVTGFLLLLFFGQWIISVLLRNGIRENIREYGDITNPHKRGTPTMGGILIVGAVLIPSLLWCNLENRFIQILLTSVLWFGGIGFMDDILKIRHRQTDLGLSRRWKLLLQGTFGLLLGLIILSPHLSPFPPGFGGKLFLPFIKGAITDLGWAYIIFIIFVVMSISNAVNFADGLDGLAIVPSSVTTLVYGIFAYILGNVNYSNYLLFDHIPGSGEATVFCAALTGAGLGFLWYNAYPAQIFMGDTGSLTLGGTIATLAVILKQEFLFLIAGGIFLAEAFSVLVQDRIGIAWLGRRLFYRAPLHHTFQHRGIPETTVVVRFWIISIVLALLSLATLKIR